VKGRILPEKIQKSAAQYVDSYAFLARINVVITAIHRNG